MADFPKPDFRPISSPRISVFARISLSDAIAANNLELKRLQYPTKVPPDNSRCPRIHLSVGRAKVVGPYLERECVLIPRWCYGDLPMISGKSSPARVLMKARTRSAHLHLLASAHSYTPQSLNLHLPSTCNHPLSTNILQLSNHKKVGVPLILIFCRGCAALWWGRFPVSMGTTWRTSWSWRTTWQT